MKTLLILGALLVSGVAGAAGVFTGVVQHVDDGDSLTVRDDQGRTRIVRLAFVDAPEYRQPYGIEAMQNLRRLAEGRALTVRWHTRDRYQRYVGVAWVAAPDTICASFASCPHTLDLGHAQLTVGLAWWYRQYAFKQQDPQARGQYEFSEFEARARHVGLWHDGSPIPPWQWRREHPR